MANKAHLECEDDNNCDFKRAKLTNDGISDDSPGKSRTITEKGIEKSSSFDEFLSPKQVADTLGVSRKFVYERIARGDLESQSVGRLRRIRRSSLEKWLNSQGKGS